jgi:uncharacterized protein YrrD
MDIRLDSDVFARDGDKVGTVDRVVIDPETLEVEAFIVEEGMLFTTDRIVEPEMIDHVDGEGHIHLKLTKEQEEDLPAYVNARYVEPSQEHYARLSTMGYLTMPSADGRVLVASESYDPRYAPRTDSAIQPAAPDGPEIVDEDNLPEGTVTISEGTDVVDMHGDKLGEVEDVIYGEGREVEAVIVGSGFIFKRHIRIPATWIASTTHDRIQIDRSADDAERTGMLE